ATVLLIQTEWAQNQIIDLVTKRLSRDLNTEVSVKKIRLGFFNKLNLEGTLVRDQQKDTLLYAGKLKLEITDWFFIKDDIELKYIGLENAVVNMHRTDSVWNYQFIIDSLAPAKPRETKASSDVELYLKTLDLDNVYVKYKDEWLGQDMVGSIGSLDLTAEEFNLTRKKIFINSLILDKPAFYSLDYKGNKPADSTKKKQPLVMANKDSLEWNLAGWDVLINKFSIRDGSLSFERITDRKTLEHFDPQHIFFSGITGTIQQFSITRDTLSGKIDLKAKERSGFTVNRLKANMKFHPRGMIFSNLDIQTPNSRLRDYYAMTYEDFNRDMNGFLSNVKIDASFQNSQISSKDIAYFAPELKDLNKNIIISGKARGTVENFTATNIRAQYGKNTSLTGNLTMKGLPDIGKTFIEFNSGSLRTTYADVEALIPGIKKIKQPDLASLQYVRFDGSFSGYINNFSTRGNIQTALGNVNADVKMKIPAKGPPVYSGIVSTQGFELGKFLGQDNIGTIAFNGQVSGQGFESSGAIDLKGKVEQIVFNDYNYRNVTLNGKLLKKEFNGEAIIDDPNAKATINGFFNLNDPKQPEINVTADIQRANLKALNFTEQNFSVLGKFKLNFLGNTIDDFIGEASLYDVALTKNEDVYVFDTLHLYAMNIDDNRQIELKNSDISVIMNGKFKLSEVPATIKGYLSNYYPTYISKPKYPVKDQSFTIKADVVNIDQYLKLFNKDLSGFDYSSLQAAVNTEEEIFQLNASIPQASYGKYTFQDFRIEGNGDLDTLRTTASAGTIVVNDSLQFPSTSITVLSAGDVSDFSISTSANQTINAANLSASVKHLQDGVKIQFHPSTIVLNEKTWRIDKDGELTISKSLVDASEIRLTNGDQQLLISSIPSELGNSHDIIIELRKVNLGDILPFVLQEPRIEGITNGEITVEDPLNKLRVYINAQTDQTRFENDSIGITTLNGFYDKANDKVTFNIDSDNPDYVFLIHGGLNLADSTNPVINATVDLVDTRISIIETYLSAVFSEMDGKASGQINVTGNANKPDLTGDVKLSGGGIEVDYTKVYYKLDDAEIHLRPGLIDIGEISMTDPLGNKGTIKGKLQHDFFKNMRYDFSASSSKMLVLNTNKLDNDLFYGRAIARVNFLFSGPEQNMKMYITGAPVDSSNITIVTSGTSKQSGEVDYIVWREYGREMNVDSLKRSSTNLSMDFDLAATNLLKMTVVLDPVTGDSITAAGTGNLKIVTGTNEAMTMNGRINIDRGLYNFNFQDIFNKPFTVEPGSYISWTGNPYDADININAKYVAEKVRISTLFEDNSSTGVSTANSDVLREISDVIVLCNLGGTLSSPTTNFEIQIPPNSPVKNNPSVDNKLKTINRDQNEVSKQSTYLIVFKSFAPQSAIVTSDLNQELLNNTISGVINAILANSVQNFFYKLFGSSLDVNFNYSRVATDLTGTQTGNTSTSSTQDIRENVSLEFIKSLVNNRLIITFGSDFNFDTGGSSAVTSQSFLFLPDVNVEYKITPDGKFRTSFFYRSSYDALSSSGKRDRTGGNISYRTE
ncbi:MAG TPA: translocation/assembly module TamB domain-containing protein, partial [Chitinophagaceae bacterium]|nr:translocation/assembly module TamB domain-containing protein [Chitinophagaceae bacterium]